MTQQQMTDVTRSNDRAETDEKKRPILCEIRMEDSANEDRFVRIEFLNSKGLDAKEFYDSSLQNAIEITKTDKRLAGGMDDVKTYPAKYTEKNATANYRIVFVSAELTARKKQVTGS